MPSIPLPTPDFGTGHRPFIDIRGPCRQWSVHTAAILLYANACHELQSLAKLPVYPPHLLLSPHTFRGTRRAPSAGRVRGRMPCAPKATFHKIMKVDYNR